MGGCGGVGGCVVCRGHAHIFWFRSQSNSALCAAGKNEDNYVYLNPWVIKALNYSLRST